MRNVNGTVKSLIRGRRCAIEGDLAHPPWPPLHKGGKASGMRYQRSLLTSGIVSR